ncbi:glutathione S-transferase family protein [Nitratireductor sp. GISD-1A_MAKvit]|uniref:glutathione S-transferase family protein n=1 Tax=Nitratireductor sp. GISD-1A_MAKvit TaxID=3234198 RepID=UPI0034651A53
MLTFFHAPWSRSSSILWLLEELGIQYALEVVDIRSAQGVPEPYRAIQPSKKVPAIVMGDHVITERAAIAIFLADRFPEAGLAPAIDDPCRGEYLTAMVYCDAVFDPVVCANVHGLEYENNQYPFGLYEDMLAYLERCLTKRRFAAGNRFTAADTQLATAINYTMNMLGAVPERPVFKAYINRIMGRAAYGRAQQIELELSSKIPFFTGR